MASTAVADADDTTPLLMELPIAKEKYIAFLEDTLNRDIGWFYWKKYIASAFWSQINLPINLVITLLTAITTAQANTDSMLPADTYKTLTIVTLIITVLNTFFRPHDQMTKNIEKMREWNAIGVQFEDTFYEDINTPKELDDMIQAYKTLQDQMNDMRKREGPETVNFITDLVHLCASRSCLRGRNRWLDTKQKKKFIEQTLEPLIRT